MNNIIGLAAEIAFERLLSNKTPMPHSSKTALGLCTLFGFLSVAGLGFLLFGAYMWLSVTLAPAAAAIWTGVIALVLAAVMALTAEAVTQRRQRHIKKTVPEIADNLRPIIEAAKQELALPVQENPKTALLVAAVAGMFIAGKFR